MDIPKTYPVSPDLIDRTQPQSFGEKLREALFNQQASARNLLSNFQTGVSQSTLPAAIKSVVGGPGAMQGLGYTPGQDASVGGVIAPSPLKSAFRRGK